MRLDFLTLKLFVAVAEESSIAGAAVREHLVPSAVSKRLGLLEESLGVELLTRHTKGVTLTPAGQMLLLRARDILRSVETTSREISEYTSTGQVHIRLSANHSSMVQFLPGDLASFLLDNPRSKVDLVERLSADVVRAVADGMADVGIYCWPAIPQGLVSYPYRSDELVIAAPLSHPLSGVQSTDFEQVTDCEFITYFPNLSASAAMPEFLNRAASRVRVHVSNFEATCRMVEEGLGIAILPLANVLAYTRQGRLACIRLTNKWAHRRLRLCIREGEEARHSVLDFVNYLVARAQVQDVPR